MSELRTLYTSCRTTCSKPWSCPRDGRRRRTPNKLHQGQKGTLPTQVEARVACEKKCQEAAEAETTSNDAIKNTLEKHRSARETRQDRDHEGGGLGDHRSGLLQDGHRTPRRSTEARERARSTAEPAKHRHPFHGMKTAQRRIKKQAHARSTKFVVFSNIMSESQKVCGLIFARRQWERHDLALLMSSVPKALSRAAR